MAIIYEDYICSDTLVWNENVSVSSERVCSKVHAQMYPMEFSRFDNMLQNCGWSFLLTVGGQRWNVELA